MCVFVRARVQRSLCSLTLQLFQSLRHQVEEKEEKGVVGGGDTKKKKKKDKKERNGFTAGKCVGKQRQKERDKKRKFGKVSSLLCVGASVCFGPFCVFFLLLLSPS